MGGHSTRVWKEANDPVGSGWGYFYREPRPATASEAFAAAVVSVRLSSFNSFPSEFPAGLFTDDRHAELSAIVFTNACTIGKFNRIGVTGHGAPEGYRYTRFGRTFDTRPGALNGIPFCLDITDPEYLSWWPQSYEPWSAEMEVIHNPFAKHPISPGMFAEATHWLFSGDEWLSTQYYPNSVLWSRTIITSRERRAPTLTDVFRGDELPGVSNGAGPGPNMAT